MLDHLLPAVTNAFCIASVLFVGRRRFRLAAVLAVAFFALFVVVTWVLWAGPGSDAHGHSNAALLGTCIAYNAVTWFPGALLALYAARQSGPKRASLSVAAVLVAGFLGAVYVYTALLLVCGFLGECP